MSPVIAPFRGLRPSHADAASPRPIGKGPSLDAVAVRDLVARGELVRDRTPALYRYEVAWGPPEARRHATAFLARLALQPDEANGARGDARAARGHDAEPVVFRYADERGWVDEVLASNAFEECARLTDGEGAEHRVWRVDRPEGVQEVVAQFEDKALRLESGAAVLEEATAHWRATGRDVDGAVLVLLAPEGPQPAPWRTGLVLSPLDEPRPRPWQEMAGDPGKAKWRTPPLG